MIFDEAFPDAPLGCEKFMDFVKLLEEPHPCFHCGRPTRWVEINYQGPLCSLDCDHAVAEDVRALSEEGA